MRLMDPTPDPAQGSTPRARRAAGNALWLISGDAAGKIASFLFVVIVARGLGSVQYGYFNFAASFVPLFLMIAAWGLNVALVREIARDRERMPELFASAFAMRLVFGIGSLVLAIAVAPLFVSGTEALVTVVLVGIALLFDELAGLVGAVFKAFETMRYDALVSITNRVASTLLALLVLGLGGGLVMMSVTYLLGSFGALFFGWMVLRRRFPAVGPGDAHLERMRGLFFQGLPLGIAAVLNMALLRLDVVMLQAIEGPVAVAMYGIAYRFFESFLFVGWALPSVVMPGLSRAGAGTESARLVQLTAASNLAFYLPLAVGAPFAAEAVVTTIFSGEFVAAADAVPWVSAAAVFYALAHLGRHASIALGRGKEIAWIAGATLGLNVILNLLLIPRYSFEGAAIATLTCEVIEAGALLWLFARSNGSIALGGVIAAPLAAAAAMGGTLLATGVRGWTAVGLGAIVYPLALAVMTRWLAPDEGRVVAGLMRRAR